VDQLKAARNIKAVNAFGLELLEHSGCAVGEGIRDFRIP